MNKSLDPYINPVLLQDHDGNDITSTYDDLGRKLSVTDPNMGFKTFVYNGFGEVIQQTDAESQNTYYQYDSLGRITNQYSNVNGTNPIAGLRSYHDIYSYSYDPNNAIGQLLTVTRKSNKYSSTSFDTVFTKHLYYDAQNRMNEEITELPKDLTKDTNVLTDDTIEYSTKYYHSNVHNRLKQVVYDDRYSVENRYTRYGSLLNQSDNLTGKKLMRVRGWNEKGQEISRDFNQNTSAKGHIYSDIEYYPSTGQVKKITNGSLSDTEILDYEYDVWGNIAKQELERGSFTTDETFTYDAIHRLKTATVSGATGDTQKTYEYDEIGNIVQKSDFSMQYAYGNYQSHTTCGYTSTPGPNAVKSAALVNGSTLSYHYDARGNRIKDCNGGPVPVAEYTYDYNNLLIESNSSITGTNQFLEFAYGADNQRYRKFDHKNNEITLYANKDYEQIYDSNGILKQNKYYITSYMTVTRDFNNGARKVNFMQKDRLGSTTQILDEDGVVLHTKSYDAFGKPRNGDWSDMGGLFDAKLAFDTPLLDANGNIQYHANGDIIVDESAIDISKRGFTDHEHLDEMQLIHMNGRMYDYNNGRFLSVDPFIQSPTSTQSMNPYTYIFNNPLSGVDPTGYTSEVENDTDGGDLGKQESGVIVTGSRLKQTVSGAQKAYAAIGISAVVKYNVSISDTGNQAEVNNTNTSVNDSNDELKPISETAGGKGKKDEASVPDKIKVKGDGFKTKKAAAKAFGDKYGLKGVRKKMEVQGAIVYLGKDENGDKNYGYLTPGWGPKGTKVVGTSDLWDAYVANGFKIVAWIHGHYDSNKNFSPTDLNIVWWKDKGANHKSTFLVDNQGKVTILTQKNLKNYWESVPSKKKNKGLRGLQSEYPDGIPGENL